MCNLEVCLLLSMQQLGNNPLQVLLTTRYLASNACGRPIPVSAVSHLLLLSGVPYDLSPEFVDELFTKHSIDYIIHGDDPCLLPDGTDAYAHAKKLGRFKMVRGSRLWAICSTSRKLRMWRRNADDH